MLDSNPRWGEAFLLKGIAHLNRGEVEFSLEATDEAGKYIPYDAKVHTLLAQLYLLKKDYAAGKQEAWTALQLNPRNLRIAITLGKSFLATNEYDQALQMFTKLEEVYPNNIEVLYNKALTHMARKEIPEAQALCKKILADTPGFIPALQMLVGMAMRNGNLTEALDLVKTQLDKEPEKDKNYELRLLPHHAIDDGRFANIAWLQELPDPITKEVWGGGAQISPATSSASRLRGRSCSCQRLSRPAAPTARSSAASRWSACA